MEREPNPSQARTCEYVSVAATRSRSSGGRSRSPSTTPRRGSGHARWRSRSPLRSSHVIRGRKGCGITDDDADDGSSYRGNRYRHLDRRHRNRRGERAMTHEREWDQESNLDKGQYSYRSSHHLDELRARRQESSSRRQARKETATTASRSQQNKEVASAHQQVQTLSPSPSPPNVPTARFSGPEETCASTHRPRQSQAVHTSRSPPRSARSNYPSHRRGHTRSSSRPYSSQGVSGAIELPFGARTLSRWDFAAFEPLFAHYLELHKGLAISKLTEEEIAGRWKSFVGKWNRGELAEGWYEPEMFLRMVRLRAVDEAATKVQAQGAVAGANSGSDIDAAQIMTPPTTGTSMTVSLAGSSLRDSNGGLPLSSVDDGDESDDESYGPAPPPLSNQDSISYHRPPVSSASVQGPSVPSLQDLTDRKELEDESRAARLSDLRVARKADRALQKERLDELLPRAEPGTRERQLEKRQLRAESMRTFREKSPDREVGDTELMGGVDGVDDYKRMLASMQQRKTEREIRRDEMARAKNAEREERVQAYREREENAVERLRELARQRFGAGAA